VTDSGRRLQDIDCRVGTVSGGRAEFMEASTAMARIQRVHKDHFEPLRPAEELGDAGAARSACALVATAVGFRKGYAPGASSVTFTTARTSTRAARVMAR